MRRQRRAIGVITLGFLIVSAAVHVGLGGFIIDHLPHWATPQPDQTPREIVFGQVERVRPTPTPTPTHPPTPPPRDATHRARQLQPASQHTHPDREPPKPHPTAQVDVAPTPDGPPIPFDSPTPSATALATASAAPTQAPIASDAPARFKHKVIPEFSKLCADEGAAGTVTVEVTIDADGSVAAAWVGQTSGFPCLDAAALTAAQESTYYAPEMAGRPVAETYRILYEFQIDS